MKLSEILKSFIEDKKLSEILKINNIEDNKQQIVFELKNIINSLKNDINFESKSAGELDLYPSKEMEQKLSDEMFVYTDGAVSGNPGMGGIGCVVLDKYGMEIASANQNIGIATNNIAEYKAILLAIDVLKDMKAENKKINFFADSELMVKQIKCEYKISNAELKKLWQEFFVKIKDFNNFKISHIPREQNKLADNLAVLAKSNKIINRRIK